MSIGQDAFSLCAVRRVWLPRVLCCKDWSSCCGQKKVDRCRHCRRLACGLLPCRVEGRRQDRRPNLRGRPGQCDGCPRRSRGRQTGLVVARDERPGDRTVPERDVVHAARLGRRTEGARSAVARTSDKTAAQASTRAAISPTLSWLDWRRAFGPLLSWWVLPIPLAAAAIAAVAWITSLVVRRPSRRGVPPLAIFEPEGPVIAPLPRARKRPRRAA